MLACAEDSAAVEGVLHPVSGGADGEAPASRTHCPLRQDSMGSPPATAKLARAMKSRDPQSTPKWTLVSSESAGLATATALASTTTFLWFLIRALPELML
eukprot:10571880-Alexandrium_andersonii.AAC.1